MKRFTGLALVGALLGMCANGCGGGEKRLNAGGATFIFPMMSKWADEYKKSKGIEVNYQSIGSGGGIQQMTSQTFDFGCSDGPMNEEQLKKAKDTNGDVVHIPLVMGAVVPAYNIDVKEPLKFTGPVLAEIFLGRIKKWNDKALADLNPGVDLPNKEIVVVHRSDGSGTTYIFVDYLSKVSSEWKAEVGVGTSVKWIKTAIGQKGNEAVAKFVSDTPGAIGYVELIYALQKNIKYGVVKNKAGEFVKASLESVTAAAGNALQEIPDDLRYSITDAAGKDSYPISGTSWAVVYLKQPQDKAKLIVDFLRWVTHEGQDLCANLHYAKLPKGLVERLEKKLDLIGK
jgi:phosphate transport system substrate-binding protein